MNLLLERHASLVNCTIGELSVDGTPFCQCLEDPVREIPGQPVERWKVKGDTAIPAGTYPVVITYSNRFKRDLPLLCDVPGFTGIRIHSGNTSADTEGCLLVGHWGGGSYITKSISALRLLIYKIDEAHDRGEAVEIEIRNHGSRP